MKEKFQHCFVFDASIHILLSSQEFRLTRKYRQNLAGVTMLPITFMDNNGFYRFFPLVTCSGAKTLGFEVRVHA